MSRYAPKLTEFIENFATGNIKKYNYGPRYILDFPTCKILMRKNEYYGEDIVALKIDELCIFNSTDNRAQYKAKHTLPFEKIGKNRDLTTSHIIARKYIKTKDCVLISYVLDLGGITYLLDYKPLSLEKKNPIEAIYFDEDLNFEGKEWYRRQGDSYFRYRINMNNTDWVYIKELPQQVNTVEDARALLLPDFVLSNMFTAFQIDCAWFLEMPKDFEPPSLSEEELSILHNPPLDKFVISQHNYINKSTVYDPAELSAIDLYEKHVNNYNSILDKMKKMYGSNSAYLADRKLINTPELSYDVKSNIGWDGKVIDTYIKGTYSPKEGESGSNIVLKNWHKICSETEIKNLRGQG